MISKKVMNMFDIIVSCNLNKIVNMVIENDSTSIIDTYELHLLAVIIDSAVKLQHKLIAVDMFITPIDIISSLSISYKYIIGDDEPYETTLTTYFGDII
jgi:hypothetical protein